MDIDMLIECFWKTHTIVVVWYPDISPADKIQAIRQYDASDIHWTYVLEQTELARQVDRFIDISKQFAAKAKLLWVQFIDTSIDYEKMIDDFVLSMK